MTSDRNLAFQQNTSRFSIAIIVLYAKSTRLNDCLKLVPQVVEVLNGIRPGEIVQIFED